ncbi:MAG: DUF4091 domain-containing protein [Candidatus Omnitrophica bacterium]|nr:DUF4091 domain-containing protein [Candidatus Omnitrophota bacterium]
MGKTVRLILIFFVSVLIVIKAYGEEIKVRWAGQLPDFTPTSAPQGMLLNPNHDYFGEILFSGVKILYDGKELPSDGRFKNWIGTSKGALIDIIFPQQYTINEIAMHIKGQGNVSVELGKKDGEQILWQKVLERKNPFDIPLTSKDEYWARLQFSQIVSGDTWRINIGPGLYVRGITLWGNGPFIVPEPVGGEVRKKFAIAFESIPGADAATMSDHIYWSWQRPLLKNKKLAEDGAVWAQHDKWARLASSPILPEHEKINKPVKIVMAQNEYEGALLTLTSLKDAVGKPIHDSGIYKEFVPGSQEFHIKVGPVKGPTPEKIQIVPRVFGTMRTQLWGVVPGPMFSEKDKLCPSLMMKYFTNGKTIADFPFVALPPCGSQIFWLEVKTEDAKPGIYTTTLMAENTQTKGKGPSVPVVIEVLPVKLPDVRVWVHTWSRGPASTSWPFVTEGALAKTVADKISRGISSFYGVPEPNTEAYQARQQKKDVYFFYAYILPIAGRNWVGNGYNNRPEAFQNMTEKDFEIIRNHVQGIVKRFKDAGVDYKDWCGELWDEPGEKNADLFVTGAKWIKEIDPNVQIYCNPAFPEITGFRKMSNVADVFVPFWGNWFRDPVSEWQKEIKPGRINAFYGVQGSNRSELHEELVGHYRVLPWQAFKLGLQGWGFYSYYSPRGDAYTDYEPAGSETDYSVVYPGHTGPVPSRQAEAFRDGWEDYRLLKLVAASKNSQAKKLLKEVLAQIPMDREPLTATALQKGVDFESLRLKLLRVAAKLK